MTNQEYEAKNQQLRDAYICDSDYFGRLVDVDSEYIESLEAENTNLKAEIAQLQADNRSLVDQMNVMAMKPNQEVIEWHQHPLYPETSRCCIVECTDNCFYVAHHSDIDGWLNAVTYEQLSNVKSWAYLPIGAKHE